MKSKIQVALLIDDYILDTFNSEVVRNINQSNCSQITLLIKNNKKIKKTNIKTIFKRIFKINYKKVLNFYLARQLNRYFTMRYNLLYKKILSDEIDLRITNPEVKVIEVCPSQTKFYDIISDKDLKLIKSEKIDIILRIGFRIIRGGILNSSKYGVWSYHHGDNNVFRVAHLDFGKYFIKRKNRCYSSNPK